MSRKPRFGWRRRKRSWKFPDKRPLVINPREQEVLAEMARMHLEGVTLEPIADWINSLKLRGRSHKWDKSAVRKQLIRLGVYQPRKGGKPGASSTGEISGEPSCSSHAPAAVPPADDPSTDV